MELDPEVNRRKYESEIKRLEDQRSTLEQRGIFPLHSSKFPHVDVFFAPKNALRILTPAISTPSLQLAPNAMSVIEVPSVAGRGIKVRFDLSNYDVLPPSLEFLDPWTNLPLPFETMFRAFEFEKQSGAHLILLPDHPITHKPFLCLRGVREYHSHPQHSGDDWFLYRGTVSLFSLVISFWRVSVDIVRPQIVWLPGTDQVQIQVQWAAEAKA